MVDQLPLRRDRWNRVVCDRRMRVEGHHIRFHDLLHTAATLMLASGVDIPTVAAILGHSRNTTTLDIYAHAVPNNLNRAVDALQRALRGPLATRGSHVSRDDGSGR